MDYLASNDKTNNQDNKSVKSKLLCSTEKENITNKDFKLENENNSFKLRNIHSFSTGTDDIKESDNKEISSLKNIKTLNIIKNSKSKNEVNSFNQLFLNLSSNEMISKESDCKEKKFKNKIFAKIKTNINNVNNNVIVFENILKLKKDINNLNVITKNIKNINFEFNKKKNSHKIKNNNDNKIFKEDDPIVKKSLSNTIKLEKKILKRFPPNLPSLYYGEYKISGEGENKYINNDCFNKLNGGKIPNIFFSHLMVKNIDVSNKNSKFISISTINRVKGKLLTILYFCPKKNI